MSEREPPRNTFERLRRAGAGGAATSGSSALVDDAILTSEIIVDPTPDRSHWRTVGRRFLRHRVAVIALVVLSIIAFLAVFVPVFSAYDVDPVLTRGVLAEARQGPSIDHLFGTDKAGRDQFTRVLFSLRASLLIGLGVALISTIIGATIGALAGFHRGWVDTLLMRFTDLVLVLPGLAVLLIIANNPEPSFFGLFDLPPATEVSGMILVISLLGWMPMARIVRGQVLSLREKEFVEAARASGASGKRIILRHLLPNTIGAILVFATLEVGLAILTEAGLSFLGAGLQSPDVSLGTLIQDAEDTVGTDLAYLMIFPGLALFLVVLCVNFIGDGLRDALDPAVSPMTVGDAAPLLEVRDLSVTFHTDDGDVTAVRRVTFDVRAGDTLAIVGESGSGKTVTARSIMGLVAEPGVVRGSVRFDGTELIGLDDADYRTLRGSALAMVFQDSLSSMNPGYRVGTQIAEAIRAHSNASRAAARRRATALLAQVGIPRAEEQAQRYPHEFSGGMRQRAMIAMAIANAPRLVIADEPTTALDVTIQAQVLDVLRDAQRDTGAALLLITHDLGVVAGIADRVAVMYAGAIVEEGTLDEVFLATRHPYTRGLLDSVPRAPVGEREPLLAIPGRPPSLVRLPVGCPLAPRCAYAVERCTEEEPTLAEVAGAPGHRSACFRAAELPELVAARGTA